MSSASMAPLYHRRRMLALDGLSLATQAGSFGYRHQKGWIQADWKLGLFLGRGPGRTVRLRRPADRRRAARPDTPSLELSVNGDEVGEEHCCRVRDSLPDRLSDGLWGRLLGLPEPSPLVRSAIVLGAYDQYVACVTGCPTPRIEENQLCTTSWWPASRSVEEWRSSAVRVPDPPTTMTSTPRPSMPSLRLITQAFSCDVTLVVSISLRSCPRDFGWDHYTDDVHGVGAGSTAARTASRPPAGTWRCTPSRSPAVDLLEATPDVDGRDLWTPR